MNWTGAPGPEPLPFRALLTYGVRRYRRTQIRTCRASGWATWCAWREDQDFRDLHVCQRTMSSLNCGACNRGVPYPHEQSMEEHMLSFKREAL